jgi:hypothetical protein
MSPQLSVNQTKQSVVEQARGYGKKAPRVDPLDTIACSRCYECQLEGGQRFFMIDLRRTLIGALEPSRSL